ncbi:hypothetical protein BDW22DRAFT_1388681, partial [Trametopsis cervina]
MLDSPTLARPDVQQWLISGLTMVTILLWMHLLLWPVSLGFFGASGEHSAPCIEDIDDEPLCCADCCRLEFVRVYFWLDVDICESWWISCQAADVDVEDEDDQYWDAEEWIKEVSLVDVFVDCEVFDVCDEEDEDLFWDVEDAGELWDLEDEDQFWDVEEFTEKEPEFTEEEEPLNRTEESAPDTFPLEAVEPCAIVASEVCQRFCSVLFRIIHRATFYPVLCTRRWHRKH